ncbi:MAG: polyphosphate kinase, partial [Kiloniellaceae bacterium]
MSVKAAGKAKKPKRFHLAGVALDKTIERAKYEAALAEQQLLLRKIQQAYLASGDRGIVVFEGWDAAGKGGTIRRMSAVMDPRGFK